MCHFTRSIREMTHLFLKALPHAAFKLLWKFKKCVISRSFRLKAEINSTRWFKKEGNRSYQVVLGKLIHYKYYLIS
jgi:hypothetical protein